MATAYPLPYGFSKRSRLTALFGSEIAVRPSGHIYAQPVWSSIQYQLDIVHPMLTIAQAHAGLETLRGARTDQIDITFFDGVTYRGLLNQPRIVAQVGDRWQIVATLYGERVVPLAAPGSPSTDWPLTGDWLPPYALQQDDGVITDRIIAGQSRQVVDYVNPVFTGVIKQRVQGSGIDEALKQFFEGRGGVFTFQYADLYTYTAYVRQMSYSADHPSYHNVDTTIVATRAPLA